MHMNIIHDLCDLEDRIWFINNHQVPARQTDMLAKDLNIGYLALHVNQGGQLALQTQHFCCRLRQNLQKT